MTLSSKEKSTFLKQKLYAHGFSEVGISKAEFLDQEAKKLEDWLAKGYHGKMSYMENHFDLRLNPQLLVDGAKSVVSISYNYFPDEELPGKYKVSKYAYGKDYHKVIKKKLKQVIKELKSEWGDFNVRAFVDSAPVMERVWAERSGLGWNGKNTLLINKHKGSFYFLAELILDIEMEYDTPTFHNHCGTCTACIDACPTGAIVEPYQVDGSKCISYYTIELKDNIPNEVKGKFENWVFGCDICQDVCPWNKKSTPHQEEAFFPKEGLLTASANEFEEITLEVFDKTFESSPIKRSKYEGFIRNLAFVKDK